MGVRNKSKEKEARELRERCIADGITPLEVLLKAMRDHYAEWETMQTTDKDKARKHLTTAAKFAVDAAPYVHPKLSSIEYKDETTIPTQINIIEKVREATPREATPRLANLTEDSAS